VDFGRDQHPLLETSIMVQMSPALRQDGEPGDAFVELLEQSIAR